MNKLAPSDRATNGPFDSTEQPVTINQVSVGSIAITPTSDLAIRVEVEESSGKPIVISLAKSNSLLQVVAFAAPASEGLWAEVQDQLRNSIRSSGGTVTDALCSLGECIEAEIPQDGGSNRHVRFIGVDGPRWFLKGTVTGAALLDPVASVEIEELFRSLIVVRGDAPLPPREMLPLLLPEGSIAPPRLGF